MVKIKMLFLGLISMMSGSILLFQDNGTDTFLSGNRFFTPQCTAFRRVRGAVLPESEIQRVLVMCIDEYNLIELTAPEKIVLKTALEGYLRNTFSLEKAANYLVTSQPRQLMEMNTAKSFLVAARLSAKYGLYLLGKSGIGSYLLGGDLDFAITCITTDVLSITKEKAEAILKEASDLFKGVRK